MGFLLHTGQPRGFGTRAIGVGRKKEIAHVRARQVDLRADLVQSAAASQKGFAGLRLIAADVIQLDERTSGSADDAHQQAAESERERQPRRPAALDTAGGFFADRPGRRLWQRVPPSQSVVERERAPEYCPNRMGPPSGTR